MTKTSLLPDVNVWIAMTFRSHPDHPKAAAWFQNLTDEDLYFCRMTQQGFLRIATNPKALPNSAVTSTAAWALYDAYFKDPQVMFSGEPPNTEARWRAFSQGGTFSPKVWSDAFLAAFSVEGNFHFVTCDIGFVRYPGLSYTIL